MSLLIAAVVIYGFSHTVEHNLIHPAILRPLVLYIHAVIFSGWVIIYILQSTLVRLRNVKLHQRLGWLGAVIGIAIPPLGIATAITMARFRIANHLGAHAESDLFVQFFDMISFTIPFVLSIYWRKRPEFHRRLILVASCSLTSAAFGRFPSDIFPSTLFYLGVDALIFLGIIRDVFLNRRIHQVYSYSFPAIVVGQTFVMYVDIHDLPAWLGIAKFIVS